MAHSRSQYKDKITEFVGGSMIEFYKARFLEKNGVKDRLIEHWDKEVETLLTTYYDYLFWPIKGNWDRKKAAKEALAELEDKKQVKIRQRAAEKRIDDYDFKPHIKNMLKKKLDEEDSILFWNKVNDILKKFRDSSVSRAEDYGRL